MIESVLWVLLIGVASLGIESTGIILCVVSNAERPVSCFLLVVSCEKAILLIKKASIKKRNRHLFIVPLVNAHIHLVQQLV